MENKFDRPIPAFIRAAQRMLGSGLTLIPNTEWKEWSTYALDEHPGLQLKVYHHAQIHFLWHGRPVATARNTEEERYIMKKYRVEAGLPFVAMSRQSVQEALAFAQDLDKK